MPKSKIRKKARTYNKPKRIKKKYITNKYLKKRNRRTLKGGGWSMPWKKDILVEEIIKLFKGDPRCMKITPDDMDNELTSGFNSNYISICFNKTPNNLQDFFNFDYVSYNLTRGFSFIFEDRGKIKRLAEKHLKKKIQEIMSSVLTDEKYNQYNQILTDNSAFSEEKKS